MNDDPTEDEERLAEQLADEALAYLSKLMTDRERQAIRNELIDRLLFTTAGRLQLKAAMPPPVVDRSGEVARTNERSANAGVKEKKAGSSS